MSAEVLGVQRPTHRHEPLDRHADREVDGARLAAQTKLEAPVREEESSPGRGRASCRGRQSSCRGCRQECPP